MKKGRDFLKPIRRGLFTLHNPTPQMDLSERYRYKPILRWNPQVEEYFIKAYGADHFSRISKALTTPSCYSCIRVNTLKSTSDAVIEKLLAIIKQTGFGNDIDGIHLRKSDAYADFDMGQKQKSLSKESKVYQDVDGCSKAELSPFEDANHLKESLQSGLISKCRLPGLDYVVFVRGSGPHTIEYGYACDKPPKEVIVSRKCAEAVLRGAQVFVPGVLACSAHVEKGDVVAVSVAVEQPGLDGGWGTGITRGTVLQGLQTDPHYFERNGLYIGQGTTMMSRAGIFRVPEGIAVDMNNRVYKLPSFNDVLEGEIFLQNLPSIITAHALDAQQGERILDMCAAPGGKTTAIAILMKDDGEVVAVDRSHNKVLDIQNLAAEMGLSCITTYKLDALKAVCRRNESNDMITLCCNKDNEGLSIQSSDSPRLHMEKVSSISKEGLNADKACTENVCSEKVNPRIYVSKAETRKNIRRMRNGPGRNQCVGGRVENIKGFSLNSFDRVLLDAPCSALGLRPRLFAGEETIQSLRNHGKYQRRMFDQAVQLVRPGGVIVYSTCTINPGENEALVRYALDTYKFLSLASQHPRIGGPGIVGHCEFPDGYIEEWLRPGEDELVQRFDPSSPLDTIGFFIAKFNVGPKDA
ncbi:hypothetical protein L1049_023939 [Liquidambar formosana]|uniref:SAM-dependent MTase RsmB/NOP-type domain-containing protein n=1 Tax=Liquidambar formosana TaxID=63359 RepID=A0AAP0RZW6_LIQFO